LLPILGPLGAPLHRAPTPFTQLVRPITHRAASYRMRSRTI
jgi:hypothetical protein